MKNNNTQQNEISRRNFLKGATIAAGAMAIGFPSILNAQSKGPINAVVIGMGGRGGGAGQNFLSAAKIAGVEAKIVAVADIFPNQARRGVQAYGLPEDKCFSGFDSYIKALEQPGVNYAILAAPPGFRPPHFKACIEKGVNVFMEKPVAVDGPGCRIMYQAYEEAKKKGLKVAAGTQRRHQASYVDLVKKIQDGAIGDIITLRAYWVNGGPIWHRGEKGDTALEKQIANWYHYIWLSGDHIVEQHVHNLDVCNWIMGNDHPVRCWGMGARQQLGNKSGEIWDNFAIEYEYKNGVRMYSYCGQIKRSWSSVSEAVHGTKGNSNPGSRISLNSGETIRPTLKLDTNDPYTQEHVDLIRAIVNNTDLNEAKNVTDSTLTAIMGREAAYSGGEVTWDAILNSEFKYGPDLLYTDASKMTFGDFRTLKPPMPSIHNILKNPPSFEVAS
ncbi:MAG: Gfo/Idh/MocA family oxidoreductase [Verrucomicrobiae bacterium]|nr:Gfo/Idh/MocA family oxidoreductase [Verrucomicrobiae bacterium]